ncbi:type II toxin-antitoxin system VapC family toxin [Deinococcus reticulitermitis]|uniref:type II toxin-antitoxin system VapC family toxin n=1 Tax=Deinococcus reticulitermitis TaxID=856736 RepID=UPI001160C987|nr:type II toxin-antitoxin system VapC family toxin [Deinococcus reticulitermitis]
MTIKLPASCLLDTAFVSALGRKNSPRHQDAHAYYLALTGNRTKFYMPTFVVGEILAASDGQDSLQAVVNLLRPKILAYDIAASKRYAELTKLHPGFFRVTKDEKSRRIVDLMIVSIADVNLLESIISHDTHICSTFLKGTNIEGLDIKVPLIGRYPLYKTIN